MTVDDADTTGDAARGGTAKDGAAAAAIMTGVDGFLWGVEVT